MALAALSLLALGVAACGSTSGTVVPGTRSDIPEAGPEPGDLEATARSYLDQMTELLLIPREDPQETVVSLGQFLEQNQRAIGDTVRDLAQRVSAMSEGERIYYEERFNDYFAPSTQRWEWALEAFRTEHPQHAQLIDGLMRHFD